MNIVRPDNIEYRGTTDLTKLKKIFLAGTIDNGDSIDWQSKLIDKLFSYNTNLEIYNPRRLDWCPTPTKELLREQINWELEHLENSDLIVMIILDESKSPISLLELGLHAHTNKIIVFCTENFYRFDNVFVTCQKYNIPLVKNVTEFDNIAKKIISYL